MKRVALTSYDFLNRDDMIAGDFGEWKWSRNKQLSKHLKDIDLGEGYEFVAIDNELSLDAKMDLIETCDVFIDTFDKDRILLVESVFNSYKFSPSKKIIILDDDCVSDYFNYVTYMADWKKRINDLQAEIDLTDYEFGENGKNELERKLTGYLFIHDVLLSDLNKIRAVRNLVKEYKKEIFLCEFICIKLSALNIPMNWPQSTLNFYNINRNIDELKDVGGAIDIIKQNVLLEGEKKIVREIVY